MRCFGTKTKETYQKKIFHKNLTEQKYKTDWMPANKQQNHLKPVREKKNWDFSALKAKRCQRNV